MKKYILSPDDWARAATKLRTGMAEVRAVAATESTGLGFDKLDRVIIRFEGHKFREFTKGRYDKSHPTLSHPYMVDCPYNQGSSSDYKRLSVAMALDPKAAMKSCSWGAFQVMGFHYDTLGFTSVDAFVDAMKESAGRQLDIFCTLLIKLGLDDELREHRWAAFAYRYNGANFRGRTDTKSDDYDLILERWFKHFSNILKL